MIDDPFASREEAVKDLLTINSFGERVLKIGDRVKKITGDYKFNGNIVALFTKRDGKSVRVVVENDDGILHIFSEKNIVRILARRTEDE